MTASFPLPVNNPPTPPQSGRFVAGAWGTFKTIGGVTGIWLGATQGKLYSDVFLRTQRQHQNDVLQSLEISRRIFFDRHAKGAMPIKPELVAEISGYNRQRLARYGKSLATSMGLDAARDIFLEHGLDTSVLPTASITVGLRKFLSNSKVVKNLAEFVDIETLIFSPITSFIFFAFQPFGVVNLRVVNLICFTYLFVFLVIGYVEADNKYCNQYSNFFLNKQDKQTRKNIFLFTITFLLKGEGCLLEKQINK